MMAIGHAGHMLFDTSNDPQTDAYLACDHGDASCMNGLHLVHERVRASGLSWHETWPWTARYFLSMLKSFYFTVWESEIIKFIKPYVLCTIKHPSLCRYNRSEMPSPYFNPYSYFSVYFSEKNNALIESNGPEWIWLLTTSLNPIPTFYWYLLHDMWCDSRTLSLLSNNPWVVQKPKLTWKKIVS